MNKMRLSTKNWKLSEKKNKYKVRYWSNLWNYKDISLRESKIYNNCASKMPQPLIYDIFDTQRW